MTRFDPDWLETFVAAETHLREHADPVTNRPAQLPPVPDADDGDKWRMILAWLSERGWRIAYDDHAELWFFPPGPLTDPGDVARNLN